MAVYYKFKSARDYDTVPMDGPFISVGTLKDKIFQSKHLGRGTDFDLVVSNAQTNEEYLDEAMLIPKNTSVLIRRVPGQPRMPIISENEPNLEKKVDSQLGKSCFTCGESSAMKSIEDTEWDEFGNDLYSIPQAVQFQSTRPISDALPTNKADEDVKIKALVDAPALEWQWHTPDMFGSGRGFGFGRGMAGRMGGRGFERRSLPPGYICHRCKVPGHFIQHCPTNGDPNYDIKRIIPPTGIPKSMLVPTPDGSYALPSGAVAVLKPNEAAFDKEIEGLPTTIRAVSDLPPELYCPLCKEVMKDAVLTSKCCFQSYCDKCIRSYIISNSKCVCGAMNILADDLLPNLTVRNTINRILESGNSSAEIAAAGASQVPDMASARCHSQPKVLSPSLSGTSRGEHKPMASKTEAPNLHQNEALDRIVVTSSHHIPEKIIAGRAVDASEAKFEMTNVKEAALRGGCLQDEEDVHHKMVLGEAGKKKKKKKVPLLPIDAWKASHEMASESCMLPMGSSAYGNPYWMGMHGGMEGYMGAYSSAVPFMGYGLAPFEMQFGGGMMPPVVPFGTQNLMMSPPMQFQRDVAAESRMRMGTGNMKASLRNQCENERMAERDARRDWEVGRESDTNHGGGGGGSGGSDSSWKPNVRAPASHSHHHRPERRLQDSGRRETKRKAEHCHEGGNDRAGDDDTHRCDVDKADINYVYTSKSALIDSKKGSVFSRISFPEEKQKNVSMIGGDLRSEASDDDGRHFKRKVYRVEPSRPPVSKH